MGAGADGEVDVGLGQAGLEVASLPDEVEAQARVAHMDAHALAAQPLSDIVGQLAGQHQVQAGDQQQRAG
ncbi:hypothetical protein RZS08_32595, partial [Arthrospira platensis SPKY1]|nr:hypothetical protein [Arthrospira platensis SPKY1]